MRSNQLTVPKNAPSYPNTMAPAAAHRISLRVLRDVDAEDSQAVAANRYMRQLYTSRGVGRSSVILKPILSTVNALLRGGGCKRELWGHEGVEGAYVEVYIPRLGLSHDPLALFGEMHHPRTVPDRFSTNKMAFQNDEYQYVGRIGDELTYRPTATTGTLPESSLRLGESTLPPGIPIVGATW